ncbi:MAG: RsmE family RNA methyltransferase [Planctomycetota bacterium]|jgi:RsmE family RNA methyltransferase
MNLILLEHRSTRATWPADDHRSRHVVDTLGMSAGDEFDVGHCGGEIGKARILNDNGGALTLAIRWTQSAAPPLPLTLLAGLPRPQTARRMLRECTSLGVREFCFFGSDRGEPSYRQSRLWATEEWKRHLREGAEQAFATHIPPVTHVGNLAQAIASLSDEAVRLALDVYESAAPLIRASVELPNVVLAVGAERGWSAEERSVLRSHGFQLVHIGQRVLRSETAALAAIGTLASHRGWLNAAHQPPGLPGRT